MFSYIMFYAEAGRSRRWYRHMFPRRDLLIACTVRYLIHLVTIYDTNVKKKELKH